MIPFTMRGFNLHRKRPETELLYQARGICTVLCIATRFKFMENNRMGKNLWLSVAPPPAYINGEAEMILKFHLVPFLAPSGRLGD